LSFREKEIHCPRLQPGGRCGVKQKSIGKDFVKGINPDPMGAGRISINAIRHPVDSIPGFVAGIPR